MNHIFEILMDSQNCQPWFPNSVPRHPGDTTANPEERNGMSLALEGNTATNVRHHANITIRLFGPNYLTNRKFKYFF